MTLAVFDDLICALDGAISRREQLPWEQRERAVSAFDAIKSDRASRGTDPLAAGLSALAKHFDLDDDDVRLMAVAAAAETDPVVYQLCGLLSGDDEPRSPTAALAWELAGLPASSAAAVRRLSESGQLLRQGLLTAQGSGPLHGRRLRVPDRVATQLLGDDTPPAALLQLLERPAPVGGPVADTISRAIRGGHRLVWVRNLAGAAGTAVAAGACRELDAPCLLADLRHGPGHTTAAERSDGGAVRSVVAALVLEAALTGSILILTGEENLGPAADLLQLAPLPVIAVSAGPWDPLWTAELPVSVIAPRLRIDQRVALWTPVFGGRPPDPDVAALRLTPEQIDRVGQLARVEAELDGQVDVTPELVRGAVRRLGQQRSSASIQLQAPALMEDLVLGQHADSEFRRLLGWARNRDEVLAQGLLQGKGGKGSGICALFAGSPGTGKTLAAHIVADALGMDLFTVELTAMVDKYIGETEKNLERVFTEAESLNAVLFFDEADALFGSRSEVRDAHDRYANQEVAYLLQRMEQFDGIAVLATNLRGNLDVAFARRLHFIITFPDPDAPTRRRLWTKHLAQLSGMDPADPVDIDGLAGTLDITGGDIRNIVLAAAYGSVEDGSPVGMRHVIPAVSTEFAKLGRRVPAQYDQRELRVPVLR